ncbi:DapH/DapD/GlmU-related protein [Bacillus sp. AFS017336]|uniref:acyltransferase n=1 Tax=Bacillus sp. AFS017336 TaxID=2033489 RepID=UPI000BF15E76|nr:acyltransferase [Bacillus sp. AFS017336]PEL13547.1 acetyltransferase [Bacillus sp. AFS017336]
MLKKILVKVINTLILRRSFLEQLKQRGLKAGNNVSIYNTKIDYSHCFLIEIGNDVTITNSTLLAHDASTQIYLRKSRVGKIIIGDRVFIGWGSIILPNVVIGNDVIVASGSIVTKDIPSNTIVAGVPAKVIGKTSDYIEKNRELLKSAPNYDTYWKKKSKEEINLMINELNGKIGFDE